MWSIHTDIVIRVAVAFGLTFVLGFEREIRGSAAGDRTFSLIGVGTAVIGVLSAQGAPNILTGAVTGVGFIGAGLLFRQTDHDIGVVHGITTAATILAAAGIGAVAGEGELTLAALATGLVLLALEIRYIPFVRVLDARRWSDRFKSDTDGHAGIHIVSTERTDIVVTGDGGQKMPPVVVQTGGDHPPAVVVQTGGDRAGPDGRPG
jgi:putative Mg2+ transporter-C (MgtC) family protein